jgi:pimeloyl-ACP methyl ester carboxylesterase
MIEIAGARIAHDDSGGAGAAVVLLHAGTGSRRAWRHQVPALAGAGLRVVAYDRCGHGSSEGAGSGVAAQDLLAFLDALKISQAHFVGTAAGAIVALDFALSHPMRVAKLVLANTHAGIQDEDYVALQKRLRPSPQFDALPPDVKELGPSYRAANPDGAKQWIALEQEARHKGALTLPKTSIRITFDTLAKLSAPTLLLTGDTDLYMPPPVLRLIASRIPNATTAVVPECGHSAFWEQPDLFNKLVLDFLTR